VREDVRRLAEDARTDLFRKKAGHDVRRLSQKLNGILEALGGDHEDRPGSRDRQWAVKARVARRASDLKAAINGAGSVYLAARLREVRTCVKKLRYGAELASEVAGSVA